MKFAARLLALLPIALVLASGSANIAHAQDLAIALKAGTTGIGGDLTLGLSSQLNLRGGGAGITTYGTSTQQQITYDTTAKLLTAFAVLDIHPGGGGFRVSVGAALNNNVVTGQSVGGTLVVNGIRYSARDVGGITGEVQANPFCPYIGIGLGNAVGSGGPIKFVLDVGVYYMGSPKVTLTANPTNPGQLPPGFADDLEKERQKIEDDLSKYRYYPVVALGISIKL